MESIFKYVDAHQELYIKRLSDAVAVQSVSAEFDRRPDTIRMVEIVNEQEIDYNN